MMLVTSLLLLMIVAIIHGFALYLQHKERLKWMMMISLKEGIPLPIEPAKPEVVRLPSERQKRRFSIPVPGAELFRREK